MEFLIFVCLLGLGSSSELLPKFSMIGERSMDEVPTIEIVFPDGSIDTAILDKYYSNEDDRKAGVNRCNFIGHLAEETDACIGMTGCPESEDVEFTIMSSRLNGSPMYKWNRDGNVEKIIHPYMEKMENREYDYQTDVEYSPTYLAAISELEAICDASDSCADPPPTNKLQIKVVYEKTFAEKFGNNHASAKSTIESAFVHAQTYYCHASLGTKLKIDRMGDIGFYNQKFGADDLYSRQVLAVTKQNIGTADIMVYLTGSTSTDDGILLGIAGCLGCVCDTEIGDSTSRISGWQVYKTKYWGRHSAIFYSGNLLQFSYTVAHEMGHVLGLWHDFMDWHKKIGCDKQGIMSYGDNIPTKWSECSKKDFKAYYNHATKVQGLNWCMEPAPDVCGASPAPNPQPPQGGCKNKNWKGDGYCDDENNNSGCEFDGGDCCGPAVKKNWCKACQCLDPKFGTTTTPKPKPCGNAKWKGDKYCDDENNHAGCEYDGGDCCGPSVKKNWCKVCQCLDPKFG